MSTKFSRLSTQRRSVLAGPRASLVVGCATSFVGCLTLATMIAVVNDRSYVDYSIAIFWASVVGYVFGLAATARIEATDDELVVINLVSVCEVPRELVVRANAESGVEIELVDGKVLRATAYQGSLLQAVLPTHRYRQAARRINQWLTAASDPGHPRRGALRRRIRTGVAVGLLLALVFSQAWVLLIWVTHSQIRPFFEAIAAALSS